jgi:hypothetical protein
MVRWWGIRHVRYYWHSYRMAQWYAMWADAGYVGPAQADLDYLAAIWRGEA